MDDESLPGHKLCGYLWAVLTVNSPPPQPETLNFNSRCEIFRDGSEVGFSSENGVVLFPVDSICSPVPNADVPYSEQCQRKRRVRNIGQVHGSISVVHQLHALVTHKCVKINARLVWVGTRVGDNGEARAVVLVDVYLPIAVWSGGQFPRSGATAGALFRHLRFGAISILKLYNLCVAFSSLLAMLRESNQTLTAELLESCVYVKQLSSPVTGLSCKVCSYGRLRIRF